MSKEQTKSMTPKDNDLHPGYGKHIVAKAGRTATAKPHELACKNGEKKTTSGKQRLLSTHSIKAKVRDVKSAQAEKGSSLSMTELMTFFSELIGPDADASIPRPIIELADCVIKFRRGEITKQQMMNGLYRMYEANTD